MNLKTCMPIAVAVIIGFIIGSCKLDPWTTGDSPTDIVTISKVSRATDKEKTGGKEYKSQVGVVKMSHKVHQEEGIPCQKCHHKNGNPDREKKCARCHTGEKGYDTMHGLCVDCHIAMKKGPQHCKECH